MNKNNDLFKREDVPMESTWDLESIFENQNAWDMEYKSVKELTQNFEHHKAKVALSSDKLYKALIDQ